MLSRLFLALTLFASFCTQAQKSPKRELRGAWITTHLALDWPVRSQTPQQQQTALISILDQHKATGMNAMFFQVRSQSDAMYPSQIEPWSAVLSASHTQGKDPGWDPLQFALAETRKRGMEFHAWINPYRAVANTDSLSKFSLLHVAKQHPEWMIVNGKEWILNPGLPTVRDYLMSVISDIVTRYDIDGLHFDDYFYPNAAFNDDAAYNADPRGFPATTAGRADWRRDNISLLIKRVYETIGSVKPWVKFGVSPSGIYRSSTNPAIGSNTSSGALQHYSALYADTKKWLQEGWVDYLAPQIYWFIGQSGSDYAVLVPWWNNQATNGRHIYIGQSVYKVNDPAWGPSWAIRSQIPSQMRLNRQATYPHVYGEIAFRTAFLRSNPLNVRDSIRLNIYKKPALPPAMPWRYNALPGAPSGLTATKQANNGYVLTWAGPSSAANEIDKVRQYVIYRSESPVINTADTANLLAITATDITTYTDNNNPANKTFYYTVTSVNRLYNESIPSNVTDYAAPVITCPGNDTLDASVFCQVVLPDYRSRAVVSDDATPTAAITVTQSPAAGTVLSGGSEATITLTATDAAGKTATCNFIAVLVDKTAPQITAGQAAGSVKRVSTTAGSCTYLADNSLDITVADGCDTTLLLVYTLTHAGVTTKPIAGVSIAGVVFQKGQTEVTWKATDAAGNTTQHSYTIEVVDEEAPVLSCGSHQIVSTDSSLCTATLTVASPVVTDNCGVASLTGVRGDGKPLSAPYQKGTTVITWTATDAAGNAVSCTQTITVEDREAPVITEVVANPASLFPPNHKMKNVTVSYKVADNCGPVTTTLSVASNEPESGTGDGDEPIDWQVIDNHRLKLRAERSGSGDGRIYTITITATDAAGNVSTQAVTVTVPHDRGNTITATSAGSETLTVLSSSFKVTVAPNPAKEHFLLQLSSDKNAPLQLKVTDAAGRIIERRAGIAPNSSLRIGGTYRPGTYYVEVTQGKSKQTLKLVKQSR